MFSFPAAAASGFRKMFFHQQVLNFFDSLTIFGAHADWHQNKQTQTRTAEKLWLSGDRVSQEYGSLSKNLLKYEE